MKRTESAISRHEIPRKVAELPISRIFNRNDGQGRHRLVGARITDQVMQVDVVLSVDGEDCAPTQKKFRAGSNIRESSATSPCGIQQLNRDWGECTPDYGLPPEPEFTPPR